MNAVSILEPKIKNGMRPAMSPVFDVMGVGCVAVDDLVFVESYPSADSKAEVLDRQRQCGGLVGTALVAAARLGAKCAYAGVLGTDDLSAFALNSLMQEGVDVTYVVKNIKARPVHSLIVVGKDHGTRNIFFDFSGMINLSRSFSEEAVIHSTRVLLVDHFGMEEKLCMVRLARKVNIPVVADFEIADFAGFSELLNLVDHLILSIDFGRSITSETSPVDVAKKLWNGERAAVVLTGGSEGCWYLTSSDPFSVRHLPAFPVKTVDTTGCGDVFHGAYAATLAKGRPVEKCLRFASAAAALKAKRPGGQKGIPYLEEVEAFLGEKS